jgi:DNA-binding MarR family transcriptional regulator
VPHHLDLGEYLPYLVNRLGAALAADFERSALTRHRLTIAMWRVLAVLSNDGGQRQIDLAVHTSIDVSTLSRIITRLVKMGLVTRGRSVASNREVVVQLTGKGVSLLARLIPLGVAIERTVTAGIPARDLAVVRRSLRRMYHNLAPAPHGRRGDAQSAKRQ